LLAEQIAKFASIDIQDRRRCVRNSHHPSQYSAWLPSMIKNMGGNSRVWQCWKESIMFAISVLSSFAFGSLQWF